NTHDGPPATFTVAHGGAPTRIGGSPAILKVVCGGAPMVGCGSRWTSDGD
ncbi:hypothetical protein A2U01_0075525, partial [Trifolium medium]|nr:hypothetical protein [Trifolium medium]